MRNAALVVVVMVAAIGALVYGLQPRIELASSSTIEQKLASREQDGASLYPDILARFKKHRSGIVALGVKKSRLPEPGAKISHQGLAVATLAGGCFWCVEKNYDEVPGVVDVISGFTGGHKKMPTYEEASSGTTGHTEAVQIFYDPRIISFEGLLQVLWRTADPTDSEGQYYDRGSQYRPGIYFHNEKQRKIALASRRKLNASGRYDQKVVLEIKPFAAFYKAEDYHQDYARKNPLHYGFYRYGSRRDAYQKHVWGKDLLIDFSLYRPQISKQPKNSQMNRPVAGMPKGMMNANDMIVPVGRDSLMKERKMSYKKPSVDEIKKRLTPLQFNVTQNEGTERPFNNDHWDEKRAGIYVDIVSGEPLFSSLDKFKSGTGWPSFTKPLEQENIVEKIDKRLFSTRTEVRSKHANSHLGHVFEDGPAPTGLRYCLNSAALRFIPADSLEAQGYGQFASLFDK